MKAKMFDTEDIPDRIWQVADGALVSGEAYWFAFGNPTRSADKLREVWLGRVGAGRPGSFAVAVS